MALDMDNGKLSFFLNGEQSGEVVYNEALKSGIFYPACSVKGEGTKVSLMNMAWLSDEDELKEATPVKTAIESPSLIL